MIELERVDGQWYEVAGDTMKLTDADSVVKQITEQQANKARMLRDVEKYLSRHPEVWDILADKLWGDFVDYKNVPFGDEEAK